MLTLLHVAQQSDDQLWKEVDWCVEQLELGLKTQKSTPKQGKHSSKRGISPVGRVGRHVGAEPVGSQTVRCFSFALLQSRRLSVRSRHCAMTRLHW